jgi:type II secretory pathway pseudopilin PulG
VRRPQPLEEGFTIIELVVSVSLLVTALLAAAATFEGGIVVSGNTRNRVVAAQLVTQSLEQVRGTAANPTLFANILPGHSTSTQQVNGTMFTVAQDVQWVGQRSSSSACNSTPGSGQLLQVTEYVTWPNMRGTQPVQSTTILAPPVGTYSAATGAIAVQVLTASGANAVGVLVTITGTTAQTQTTTTEGCAFFAYLNPGSYTAKVTQAGYVNDQEQATPSLTTSVTVGQTQKLQFNFDQAGTIAITGWANPAPIAATSLPVSVANTGLQPYGSYSFPAAATTLTPLFPYASGYSVFAGNCTDNNPLGLDLSRNPFYPSAAPTPVNVAPGATTSTTVPLYSLALSVTDALNLPVNGAPVTATETSGLPNPNTVVCTSGVATGSAPTLTLAPTTSGSSVTGVPLGHLTVTAKSGLLQGSVKVWVRPDGVYAVDSSGNATTLYSGPVAVVVR